MNNQQKMLALTVINVLLVLVMFAAVITVQQERRAMQQEIDELGCDALRDSSGFALLSSYPPVGESQGDVPASPAAT